MKTLHKINQQKINEMLDKHSKILNKTVNIDTFVETGSHKGATLEEAKKIFKACYSIELSSKYYDHCVTKFKTDRNVKLVHGSSIEKLPEIFSEFYNEPVIFFLDAHYSASSDCAKHEGYDPPVLFEIEIILKQRISNGFFNDIIIVDDLSDFGLLSKSADWQSVSINKIQELINKLNIDAEVYPTEDESQLIIHLKNIKENK